MNTKTEYQALGARFQEAFALAQVEDPNIVLALPTSNTAEQDPDPNQNYLVLYATVPFSDRLTMGSPAEDQRSGQVRCKVLIQLYLADDDLPFSIIDAIQPAFVAGKHPSLRFDEAPSVVAHGRRDEHFRVDATFPYQFDDSVMTAA